MLQMLSANRDSTHAASCSESINERLREVLALHFHSKHGSAYWLRRQATLGWSVCDRVRSLDDLWLLGPTPTEELRRFPLRDFIPRTFHGALHRFVVGETAGTSGEPRATVYRDDEFHAAFVEPFVQAADATGFPRGEPWLFVGPSGPHIIGKAVRALAHQTGSMDPFTVDFDPRWAKRLAGGSFAQHRYLDHVVSQALDVLERESVGVLFTMPPTLTALLRRMSDAQREAIHGVHYGGVAIAAESLNEFRAAFPSAVHLAGYGNTLFGVLMEVSDQRRQAMDYFICGERLHFEIVKPRQVRDDNHADAWPPLKPTAGSRGQVLFHRLDESCLLVSVPERDEAAWISSSEPATALGWDSGGLRDPCPPERPSSKLSIGLY